MQQKLNFPFNVRKKKKKKEIFESIQTVSLRIVQGPRYPFNRDRSATRAMANSIGSTKCWSPATPKRARFIASPHRLELINIPQKLSIPQNRIASFNRINIIFFFFFLNSNEKETKYIHERNLTFAWRGLIREFHTRTTRVRNCLSPNFVRFDEMTTNGQPFPLPLIELIYDLSGELAWETVQRRISLCC